LASCAQIDQLLQPYLDRELAHSDRVIFEQHIAECPACASLAHRHKTSDAELYETLRAQRLNRDLTDYVLSHLPEMERVQVDVASLNRRAKRVDSVKDRMIRLVPIGAAVLLVILAAVLNTQWPEAGVPAEAKGMVALSEGGVLRLAGDTDRQSAAHAKDGAMEGDRFVTGSGAHASLMLLGPSEIRLDADTSVRIESDRRIVLDRGRIYLDIAKSRRWFKVETPMGAITVFGTRFSVEATSGKTVVVVEEGEVQLTHRDNPSVFRSIKPDQKAFVEAGLDTVPVSAVDAEGELAWAEAIAAPEDVRDYFMARVQPAYEVMQISAEPVHVLSGPGPLVSITLEWSGTDPFLQYCDYEVFVATADNEPYFHAHIDGVEFSDPRRNEIVLEVDGSTGPDARTFLVKLVPVFDPERNVRQVPAIHVSGGYLDSGTRR